MDKNVSMKKKETYMLNNDVDKTITVKINLTSDHLLDRAIVESIERQLFNINLNIDNYTMEVEEPKIVKEKPIKIPGLQKKPKKTSKIAVHFNGEVVPRVDQINLFYYLLKFLHLHQIYIHFHNQLIFLFHL